MNNINTQPQLKDCQKNFDNDLAAIQKAMGKAIFRPFTDDKIQETAAHFIKPNKLLTSSERLEIYNQQYWIRLLDSLQEDFPGLIAVLGQDRFEQLAIAYLTQYPSNTFNLSRLGDRLAEFILTKSELTTPHNQLAYEITCLEWAEIIAFDQETNPALQSDSLVGIDPGQIKLSLQPYISLLKLNYVLDDFLLKLNKRSEKAVESNAAISKKRKEQKQLLPKKAPLYLAVHRLENSVYYKRLDREQFRILKALSNGKTLSESCMELLTEESWVEPAKMNEIVQNISKDFSSWMELGWFCKTSRLVAA